VPSEPSDNIVIAAIDDASLQEYGKWSNWPRSLHAQAIENLSNAKAMVIGFDVLFSDESPDDPKLAQGTADAGNRRFVYSADTGPCEELTRIAQGADLFLCEAALCEGDEPEWGHLTAVEAAELASKSNVKKLVLTHFWPDCDYTQSINHAGDIFGDNLDVAQELHTYAV
jgi:ribonuclease BN (tRNA processing enzyme)